MNKETVAGYFVVAGVCAGLSLGGALRARATGIQPRIADAQAQSTTAQGEKTEMHHAKGTFEPTLVPQGPEDKTEGSTLGRMSIAKKFHGDLEATSEGQMLTAGTDVKGSAGYVAIERVTGTLAGKHGSFVLQHSGTLTRSAPQLSVTVVPDSGTGQFAGITGTMTIKIEAGGKHFYEFDYMLPEKK
ncbi:MAG: DUF3224 domain-containing protein [Candidatus Acidiferrales bacterium]